MVFKGRTAFPFHNIGSQSGNFTFDGATAGNQKVTLTGALAHTVTFNNLVQGVNVLYVSQTGTGAVTLAIGSGNGDVAGIAVMNSSFTNGSVAATAGTHIFTILVAETKIHVSY